MRLSDKRRWLRTTFRINYQIITGYLVLMIFLLSFTWVIYSIDQKAEINTLEQVELQVVAGNAGIIQTELHLIYYDVLLLATKNEIQAMLTNDSALNKRLVAEQFLNFIRIKEIYDQIRFLDETGMEIVRVNYNNGQPNIIPQEELQNKTHRYYFTETITLESDEVYISPMDLNMEHNQIETPLKPMIRFGTPVYDHTNRKRGIILLNYLADHLLTKLRAPPKTLYSTSTLLNSDGYWLIGLQPEDEWGFMYENGTSLSLQYQSPQIWIELNASNSGQYYTDIGLFTFSTVYPLSEGRQFSTSSSTNFEVDEYYWKVLSIVNIHRINGIVNALKFRYSTITAILCFIITTSLLYLIHINTRRLLAETTLKQEELRYYELLTAQNRELSEFAHVMNHDLRNYLTSIQFTAYLLHKDNDPTHLSDIEAQVNGIQDMLSHSLTIAEAGEIIGEKQPTDLNNVVLEVKNVTLPSTVHLSHTKLPTVLADEGKLFQVFKNLFENAVVHGHAKTIRVTHYHDKTQSIIEIQNDGDPIPHEMRSTIFDKKVQSHKTGRGLGLIIIRKIIHAHQWSLVLGTEEQTTFKIIIPQK